MSRFPLLHDADFIKGRFEAGVTAANLAEEIGCSEVSLYRAIKRLGIELKTDHAAVKRRMWEKKRTEENPKLNDEQWLRNRHSVEGASLAQMASELNCSTTSIVSALQRFNISAHTVSHRTKGKERTRRTSPELESESWMREELVAKKRTMDDVSRQLNCSIATVGRYARKHKIEFVQSGGRAKPLKPQSFPQLFDEEWLRGEYLLKERLARDIAHDIGCSVWSVQAALGRFRILRFPGRNMEKRDPSLPKGTRRRHDGYIAVFKPDHPYCNARGYVLQHRLVCEEAIGRHLTPREEVHHLNEIRCDNREDNLLVMADSSAHMTFHQYPPPWIPRCECCGRPAPELLTGRPADVPLLWNYEPLQGH